MRVSLFFGPLAFLLFCHCSSAPTPTMYASSPISVEQEKALPIRPKLVLTIVLDQLPTRTLLRYAEALPPNGILTKTMKQGVFHERMRYSYAGTNTAPGHASIFTGQSPAQHGIDRNDKYDYNRQKKIKIIDDGTHPMFGNEKKFASPTRLQVPTLADRLRKQSPKSKIVSISLKARAAVVSGGKSADLVAWYNTKIPGFTTSSYYAKTLPTVIEKWNIENPVSERITTWQAQKPALYQTLNGADDAPGESNWYNMGTTFPHDIPNTDFPPGAFKNTPQSVTYLFDFAQTLVEEFQLGKDNITDLLSISVSTTDYCGHAFGVDSWEYLDILIKADQTITNFVDSLSKHTDVAVIITSDHGGTSLPEHNRAKGLPGGRLYADKLVENLEALADKELGKSHWIEAYIQPYLYLTKENNTAAKRAQLTPLFKAYASTQTALALIVSSEEARSWNTPKTPLQAAIQANIARDSTAFYVVPAMGFVSASDNKALGTGHGTPWDADREVPFLAYGVGVQQAHVQKVQAQEKVSATIATLLGISWPLDIKPLKGIATLLGISWPLDIKPLKGIE